MSENISPQLSPGRSIKPSKVSMSPKKGNTSTLISSMLRDSNLSSAGKNKNKSVSKSATPHSLMKSTVNDASHIITIASSDLSLKSTITKSLDCDIIVKMKVGGDVRTMNIKSSKVETKMDNTQTVFNVDGSTMFLPVKGKYQDIQIEIVSLKDDQVIAKGTKPINVDHYYLNGTNDSKSKWDTIILRSNVVTDNKSINLMEVSGEIALCIDIKAEAFWSDSESDGGTTATNSAQTTPGSVLSQVLQNIMPESSNKNVKSEQKVTFAEKAGASMSTQSTPQTVAYGTPASQAPTLKSVLKSQQHPCISSNSSTLSSMEKKKKKDELKARAKVAVPTISKVEAAMSKVEEVKDSTVSTVSNMENVVIKETEETSAASLSTDSSMNKQILMLVFLFLGLFISAFVEKQLFSTKVKSAPLKFTSELQSKKFTMLVDNRDNACISWKYGLFGGHARFAQCGAQNNINFETHLKSMWFLENHTQHSELLQLVHKSGKCLCSRESKNPFISNKKLALQDCNSCNDGWSLNADTQALQTSSVHKQQKAVCVNRAGNDKAFLSDCDDSSKITAIAEAQDGDFNTFSSYNSF